jgi:hypothetical protein
MTFWRGVVLGLLGRFDEAYATLQPLYAVRPEWAKVLRGFAQSGFPPIEPATLERLLPHRS